MQDYISDPRNNLKINRIKLALTHLEACDIAGEEIEDLNTASGYVEPFFGLQLSLVGRSRLASRLVYKTSIKESKESARLL